ncbi:hypothetical protein SAY87_011932 [Trapa incisa]|uniref:Protein kinase domain-containing protein n=1 Tax=Trapa incisa TaxID=236973 RepID=A0AAN7GMN4_9MYRT|nr:hypothetical protein SAY87_011932 [Trapa incisa]
MYKGSLPNRQAVAIKDIGSVVENRKFRAEILRIRNINHRNHVKLEGYYCESSHREFMGHGNLKSANVVLDGYFEAKVSEYGLTGICVESTSHALSEAENDVEDLGMLVIELVSGYRDVKMLLETTYKQWKKGMVEDLEYKGSKEVDPKELERAKRIAF